MDAFFASVEAQINPRLNGKPTLVQLTNTRRLPRFREHGCTGHPASEPAPRRDDRNDRERAEQVRRADREQRPTAAMAPSADARALPGTLLGPQRTGDLGTRRE